MPRPDLDLLTARRWAVTARVVLAGARERIDALNVFPVADGDTGTNMYRTFDGALDYVRSQFELGARTERLQEGLALIARGMLLSARGNSGVILAQLTRGLADSVAPQVAAAGPHDMAAAFETAAQTAWDALASPVEGTILTVARAAAGGARAAVRRGRPAEGEGALDVGHVVAEALAEARQALARTPEQLPELRAAGVVDAGGAGLVLVIEALQSVLQERPPGSLSELPEWWELPRDASATGPDRIDIPGAGETGGAGQTGGAGEAATGSVHVHPEGEVEVLFLLTGSDAERADRLRTHLGQLGKSVVVAGGPADFRVHVHLSDPRAAVEAGSLAGAVSQVRLTSLVDGQPLGGEQMELPEPDPGAGGEDLDAQGHAEHRIDVVACALGTGVSELFAGAGAQVVSSGPRQRASAGQLLAAIRASAAPCVVVLPNDADTVMVACAAADEAGRVGRTVEVVPSRSLVEGLAAIAVLDRDGDPEDVVPTMTQAAAGVRVGALTRAERPAETPVGPCRKGQWLGIVEHAIVAVDDDLPPVARLIVDELWHADAEVVTVLLGERADDAVSGCVAEVLAKRAPHTGPEVITLHGHQPTYPVLLGVE